MFTVILPLLINTNNEQKITHFVGEENLLEVKLYKKLRFEIMIILIYYIIIHHNEQSLIMLIINNY